MCSFGFVSRLIVLHVYLLVILEPALNGAFSITILHTNDVHARYDETDEYGFTCSEEQRQKRQCFGGMARLVAAVKIVRGTEKNVVLVDGGDRYPGTIWSEVYKGNGSIVFFNQLNYTALTLGNHEFDFGIRKLVQILDRTNSAVVCSNLNTSQEPLWPKKKQLVKKSKVVDVGGQKIGIVGYVVTSTGRTSASGPNVQFLSIIASLQEAVKELQLQNITKIIAVGHAGFDVDKEVARKVRGVDVVVGGHTNTFLYTGKPPSVEVPAGEYPYIVHPDHDKSLSVPVVQAAKYNKYLGQLQVTFDEQGRVKNYGGNPILLDSDLKKDPVVNDIVKRMRATVDKKGTIKIGRSEVNLDAANNVCTVKQCVLGQMMVDAMVYHFKAYNAAIAFFNAGGRSKSLPTDAQGYVLYKDLFDSFPYRNTIDMVELTGADILESLQISSFLQVKGLRLKYSASRRVESIKLHNFSCGSSSNCYQPIKMTQSYKVVVDSYLAVKGNKVIATKGKNRVRGKDIYSVIVNYFKDNSPISPRVDTCVNASHQLHQSYVLVSLVMASFSSAALMLNFKI